MTNEVGKDGQGQSGSSSVGSTAEVNSTELPGDESMDDSEILEEYLDEQAGDDAQRPADQSYDAAPDDAESDDNYKIDQYREDYLRAIAELQNVKRRSEADVAKARKYGSESMARGLLDVKDSLDLARSVDLSDATEDSMKRMQEGLELTLRQLETVLEKHGVIEVSPKMGDKLDPSLHQAMSIQPSDAVKPNHVLAVVQKGYQLHDRLLRAAMVIVAKRADAAEPTTNVTDIDQDQAGADMKEGSPDE